MPRMLLATTVHETFDAFLVPYAQHFTGRGWRVDVMAAGATSCRTCTASSDRAYDATWERSPLATSNGSQVTELRRIVAANGYDIVHVHTPVAAFLTRLALRPRSRSADTGVRPRIVYTAHGFHFDERSRLRSLPFEALERRAGRWTDHLVVINDEDHAWAVANQVVAPGALEQMPGIGLDLSHYARTNELLARAATVRRQLGIQPHQPLFTMVAEYIPRKRHADALDALARLGRQDAHLALIGDGLLMDDVRRRASELGLADRCHILGRQSDPRPHVLAAQALLLPSTREGLPRCVLEAMAMGVPVIATDIRGTRSLLADGRGRLVPVGRPDRLAAAMDEVTTHPDLADMRARRAVAHVEQFDIEQLLHRHEDAYERLLGRTRPEAIR